MSRIDPLKGSVQTKTYINPANKCNDDKKKSICPSSVFFFSLLFISPSQWSSWKVIESD